MRDFQTRIQVPWVAKNRTCPAFGLLQLQHAYVVERVVPSRRARQCIGSSRHET